MLILGDSISIGYTPVVIAELKGQANVVRARQNCGDTNRGLGQLDNWLGKTDWEVIHFNWGLHDLCYRHPDSKVQGNRDKVKGTQAIPVEDYSKNLDQLVERLEKTGAKLIWASTTAVPEGEQGRFVEDAVKYNEAAAKIMEKYRISTDDLHAASEKIGKLRKKPNDVHFTTEGYEILGKKVADSIREALPVQEIKGE
ncbi:MAG: SGNH/GDSL hydrolase family protein [Luteolibacter sp.]